MLVLAVCRHVLRLAKRTPPSVQHACAVWQDRSRVLSSVALTACRNSTRTADTRTPPQTPGARTAADPAEELHSRHEDRVRPAERPAAEEAADRRRRAVDLLLPGARYSHVTCRDTRRDSD